MVASPTVQRQVNLAYSQSQLRSEGLQGMQQRQLEQREQANLIAQQQAAQKIQAQQIQQQAPTIDYEGKYQQALKHVDKGMGWAYIYYGEDPIVKDYVKKILKGQGYTFQPGLVKNPEPIKQEPLMLPRSGVNLRFTPQGEIIQYKPTTPGETGTTIRPGEVPFPRPYPTLTPIPAQQVQSNIIQTKVSDITKYYNAFEVAGARYIGLGTKSTLGLNTGEAAITAERIKQEAPKYLYTPSLIGVGSYGIKSIPGEQLIKKTAAEFIPTTPTGVALTAVGVATPFAPTIVKYPLEATFTFFGAKTALNSGLPTEQRVAGGIVAGLGGYGLVSEGIGILGTRVGPKPKVEVPTKELIKEVQPFSRQSSRVLIVDREGNYLLGKKASGEIISIGGGIEKGQTPTQAAKAEFLQELFGINTKYMDPTNVNKLFRERTVGSKLTFEGKQVFPEETFNIFTIKLNEQQIAQLKAQSDIPGGIVRINPSEIKGIRGMTPKNPTEINNVRVYEASLINWLESGKKIQPTWMYSETPQGRFYYGTQSRYNVPGSIQEQYLSTDNILLAHGTPSLPIKENIITGILPKKQIFGTKFGITKEAWIKGGGRGEPGLYVQPPISAKKTPPNVFEESFVRKGETIYLKERQPIGKGLIENKAGTFVKFTNKQSSPGYIGLSYLGIGRPSEYLVGFKPKGTKGALLLKEIPESPIRMTMKAKAGKESELIINVGTEIQTTGKPKTQFIGGKRIKLQPAEITKIEEVSASKLKGGEETFAIKKYIAPTEFLKTSSSKDILRSRNIELKPSYSKTRIIEKGYSYTTTFKEVPKVSTLSETFTSNKSFELAKPSKESFTGYKIPGEEYTKPEIITPETVLFKEEEKKRRKELLRKFSRAYKVYSRRKGKFFQIASGVSRSKALEIGSKTARSNLSRTFAIEPTNTEILEVQPNNFQLDTRIFREPFARSKLKSFAREVYIQKKGGRKEPTIKGASLASYGETREIQMFKRQKSKRRFKLI